MRITKWGYDNEQSFIKAAMVSVERRNAFKQFNIPLIEGIAEIYVRQYRLNPDMLLLLTDIGLQSFDKAFNNYIQLPNPYEGNSFLFSTYFVEPLRTVMEEYLEEKGFMNKK